MKAPNSSYDKWRRMNEKWRWKKRWQKWWWGDYRQFHTDWIKAVFNGDGDGLVWAVKADTVVWSRMGQMKLFHKCRTRRLEKTQSRATLVLMGQSCKVCFPAMLLCCHGDKICPVSIRLTDKVNPLMIRAFTVACLSLSLSLSGSLSLDGWSIGCPSIQQCTAEIASHFLLPSILAEIVNLVSSLASDTSVKTFEKKRWVFCMLGIQWWSGLSLDPML